MTENWKTKCALGEFLIEYDPDKETWKAGEFPPVKESLLVNLMGKHGSDDFLLVVLQAMAWRAHKKVLKKSPDELVAFVVNDVKRGKAPPKKTGEWSIQAVEQIQVNRVKDEADLMVDMQNALLDDIQDWGQNAAVEAARVHRERVAEGYIEYDLDGNPKDAAVLKQWENEDADIEASKGIWMGGKK